jgi:hypothetical protein
LHLAAGEFESNACPRVAAHPASESGTPMPEIVLVELGVADAVVAIDFLL